MQFKKKHQEIEAVQWHGWYTSDLKVKLYIHRDPQWKCPKCGGIDLAHGWVENCSYGHIICPGDYFIRDTNFTPDEVLSYSAD